MPYKKVYKKRTYKKKTTMKKSNKPSRQFKKKVLATLHKYTESKQAYHSSGDTLVSFNSGINASADAQRLIPNVAQGTAENQRVGDEVRAQVLKIKGVLQMYVDVNTNSIGPKRVAVRMMIVQPKRYNTWTDISTNAANWMNSLLKKGGTVVSFTGLISDLWAPINTPAITKYYDKVMYFNQEYIANTTSIGQVPLIQGTNVTKFFSKTFKLKNKRFDYDANIDGNILPTRFNPVLILGYVHLSDPSNPDTLTTQISLQYDTTLTFEDA